MINICLLLKLTVEECINHIAGQPIFRLDPGLAERQNWYRTNWIALEFDLLYRWNNSLLEELGLISVVNAASQQAADPGPIRSYLKGFPAPATPAASAGP